MSLMSLWAIIISEERTLTPSLCVTVGSNSLNPIHTEHAQIFADLSPEKQINYFADHGVLLFLQDGLASKKFLNNLTIIHYFGTAAEMGTKLGNYAY